jgi:hypothetical protein
MRLITVRVLMWPPNAKLAGSAPAVLNDRCRTRLDMSRSPLGVVLRRKTSFQDNHILSTTAFGNGGVTVWGCFPFDCKLDLYVLDGNLTGQKYRDNVLATRVVPYFDNHALADRPMFIDDNARPPPRLL